jgi:hypothetical protein
MPKLYERFGLNFEVEQVHDKSPDGSLKVVCRDDAEGAVV